MSIYNLAVFTSSFPYPSIEVGAVVTGIVIANIIACGGKNSRFKGTIRLFFIDFNKFFLALFILSFFK